MDSYFILISSNSLIFNDNSLYGTIYYKRIVLGARLPSTCRLIWFPIRCFWNVLCTYNCILKTKSHFCLLKWLYFLILFAGTDCKSALSLCISERSGGVLTDLWMTFETQEQILEHLTE